MLRYEHAIIGDQPCNGEIVGIFTAEGRLVREYFGSSYVVLPESERDLIEGSILTHRHCSGYPFSDHDILEASRFRLLQMRVVTRHARYALRAPAGVWQDPVVTGVILRHLHTGTGSLRGNGESRLPGPETLPEEERIRIREAFLRRAADRLGLVFEKASRAEPGE